MAAIPAQQSRDEIMNVIREGLYKFGDMHMLAIRTGLSRSYLQNIKSGKTMWPRWNTLETIMIPLNIRMIVRQY